jgi:hypothetical protein
LKTCETQAFFAFFVRQRDKASSSGQALARDGGLGIRRPRFPPFLASAGIGELIDTNVPTPSIDFLNLICLELAIAVPVANQIRTYL